MNFLKNIGYIKLLLIHIGIGYSVFIFRPLSAIILHVFLIFFLLLIVNNKNRNNEALMAAAYIAGAEVFFRMTHATIFWETGKYSVILFLIIGMVYKGSSSKSITFWLYLLILFPGVVVASFTLDYNVVFRKAIAFNLAGPVCLGISAIYCYYKKVTKEQMSIILVMFLMPFITTMIYLYLYTPSIGEVLGSGTNSNVAASGGYGPNQISTVLGMGGFILVTRLFLIKKPLINLIDITILGFMSYRALVTFSRGGVITALICIAVFILFYTYKQNSLERGRIFKRIFIFFVAFIISGTYAVVKTEGLLINRYTNRDAAGELEDDITTGRAELIITELRGFYENPVIGIGVGKGKDHLSEVAGREMPSHNEVSRLLSEHGIFGLLAIIILIFVPVIFWFKFENNYYFLAFVAFWFLTINHSSMRIALPGFVYGLALLYLVDEKKNPVHRERFAGT